MTAEQTHALIQQGQLEHALRQPISLYFKWGEVFTNCSPAEIKACQLSVLRNAVKQAQTMDKVRTLYNLPVVVHSWYRDLAHNKRVGGSAGSYHPKGLASDFHVQGYEGRDKCLLVQQRLDREPFMKACGLEFTGGDWCHVDSRGRKGRF